MPTSSPRGRRRQYAGLISDLEDELAAHLAGKATPLLFVGAGMSRRYVDLDSWEGLLRRFAKITGKPYGQYSSDAAGDFPSIATAIAQDYSPLWWQRDEYAERRERFQDGLRDKESRSRLRSPSSCPTSTSASSPTVSTPRNSRRCRPSTSTGSSRQTTTLLEHLFPNFKCFVGQEELLFSEVQSVGEIYKIHGSHERPDSLVLTASDYASFEQQNPYLAAKLLTIFVDHPIVFLGYRLGDRNVTRILNAIARAEH